MLLQFYTQEKQQQPIDKKFMFYIFVITLQGETDSKVASVSPSEHDLQASGEGEGS